MGKNLRINNTSLKDAVLFSSLYISQQFSEKFYLSILFTKEPQCIIKTFFEILSKRYLCLHKLVEINEMFLKSVIKKVFMWLFGTHCRNGKIQTFPITIILPELLFNTEILQVDQYFYFKSSVLDIFIKTDGFLIF